MSPAPCGRGGLRALLRAAGAAEDHLESRLAAAGLSLAKLAALHQLATAGRPLPLGQLAERLACVKSNVTQLVDRLEADGWVSRSPDPADRRSRLACITDAGQHAYARGSAIQREAEQELLGALTPDEHAVLERLLAKLGSPRPAPGVHA
jgi:DNA-binding MarR family transcriptional regulator